MIFHFSGAKYLLILMLSSIISCTSGVRQSVIFKDQFDSLPVGAIHNYVSHKPYYYHPDSNGRIGNWRVATSLQSEGFSSAWRIKNNGKSGYLSQTFNNLNQNYNPISLVTHPIITAGDMLWGDYTLEFTFSPGSAMDKCGVVFRYQDDRNFYFYGMEGNTIMLKQIHQTSAPRRPLERILAFRPFIWQPGLEYRGLVSIREDKITAFLNDSISLHVKDNTYSNGIIGLIADNPADFYSLEVRSLSSELRKYNRRVRQKERIIDQNQTDNPDPVIWKKIDINGLGGDVNIRFGELNGDGNREILVVQSKKNARGNHQITAVSALNVEGEMIWQYGKPVDDYSRQTPELPVQVHDLDGDGEREVIFVNNGFLYTLNGRTGKVIRRIPLPAKLDPTAICFADLLGSGRDNCILLSDRSSFIMAMNEKNKILWRTDTDSGSQPLCIDMNGDGKDEILFGYLILNEKGEIIRNNGNFIGDECNGIAVAEILDRDSAGQRIVYAAGDWGLLYFDFDGVLKKQHSFGHVEYFSVANYDLEKPGLEIISSNSWGGDGVMQYLDAEGELSSKFNSNTAGSTCTPVNWKGDGEEFFIMNASHLEGGLFSGDGIKNVEFPDDGHPDLCYAILDFTGDPRDEVAVWDSSQIWIYTQDNNPRAGNTYNPIRIPLYNYSCYNMQTSYSNW